MCYRKFISISHQKFLLDSSATLRNSPYGLLPSLKKLNNFNRHWQLKPQTLIHQYLSHIYELISFYHQEIYMPIPISGLLTDAFWAQWFVWWLKEKFHPPISMWKLQMVKNLLHSFLKNKFQSHIIPLLTKKYFFSPIQTLLTSDHWI